jgi:hypothetical protein
MTLTRRDLSRLGASLALFATLSAAGGGAIFWTLRAVSAGEETHRAAVAQRHDVEARLARVDKETGDLRRKLVLYRDLMARGDGGKEYRPLWLERIAESKTRRGIAVLRYELSPRRPFESASSVSGGHEFMVSSMKLQMQVAHEQDLLGFLDDVARDVRAFVRVRGCDVGRRADGLLDAECMLDWVTLRERP